MDKELKLMHENVELMKERDFLTQRLKDISSATTCPIIKELKEELTYTKGFIEPFYEKLIEEREDGHLPMEMYQRYIDDPDINLEYDFDWDPSGIGWECGYGFTNANGEYKIDMAGGGSHWWKYVIRNMGDDEYVIYREDAYGLHLQEGILLIATSGDGAQYLHLFDKTPESDVYGDLSDDYDYSDFWLKVDDICELTDMLELDVWEGEDPEDMGR